jgi:hypothetical protein
MTARDGALVDWSTGGCLGTGWHAAMAVDPDGTTWPWLVNPDPAAYGDAATPTSFPDHELLGPLPWRVRYRLSRHRCGHPCKDGHPCRREVQARGRLCPQHLTPAQPLRNPDNIRAHAAELRALLAEARARREVDQ